MLIHINKNRQQTGTSEAAGVGRNAIKSALTFLILVLGLTALFILPVSGMNQKQPIIYHNSVQVWARTEPVYRENGPSIWSWSPQITFKVTGPVSTGSIFYVEFSVPGSAPWAKFDCGGREIKEGYESWVRDCGGRSIDNKMKSTYTGPVNFTIKLRNELMGGEMTLFTGKTKVSKVNQPTVPDPGEAVFYINQDWNMPIGYLSYIADDLRGWDAPLLHLAFWTRGVRYPAKTYLLYKGQVVGEDDDCSPEVEHTPSYTVRTLPQGAQWTRVGCEFTYVRGWNKKKDTFPLTPHILEDNLGDYEIRVLINNKLARSIKFTVGADGELENGLREANKLSFFDGRVLVPVQILGDQDGPWDKNAWKTDSFYGHPLTSFTPPQ